MDVIRFILLLFFASLFACGPALAEKRVALVIGNSAYQKVPRLANPANDAAAMASMFKAAGFDSVESKANLTANELRRSLRDFAARTRDADIAVVYYAGHGIELDGTNYLIPVDATLETDGDVLDETLPLERVLFAVEPAKQLRLIILDACRDNPFARTMRRTVASRAIGRGLAKVEPSSPNTMIAFAAKAGSTASDGDSNNSPFAAALIEHLPKPGLDLRRAFGFVRDDVMKNTGNKQEPYVYGSLGGNDVPLVPARPAATVPQADPQAAVRKDYELSLQLGTREAWEAFLTQYPDGFYANLAKGQLKKIASEENRLDAVEKARSAEQEKIRLAAEGAKQAEQNRASAAAKAAEEKRLAAEKAKEAEQARAAAAEQVRVAAEKAAAEKLAAEKQKADETAASDGKKLAALSPPDTPVSPRDIARSIQVELRRVGCRSSEPDGEWNGASRRSLTLFNKYAGTKFDVKLAAVDALEAIKSKSSRVCPLVCDRGFKAEGGACVKITCRAGHRVNDDNECEKVQESKPETRDRDAAKSAAPPPASASQGGDRCRAMRDPVGCRCALQNGGSISADGRRWYSTSGGPSAPTNEAFVRCQIRAGRR